MGQFSLKRLLLAVGCLAVACAVSLELLRPGRGGIIPQVAFFVVVAVAIRAVADSLRGRPPIVRTVAIAVFVAALVAFLLSLATSFAAESI